MFQAGCAEPALEIAATMDLSRGSEGVVRVVMEIRGPQSGPLTLSSFAQPQAMGVEAFRARAGTREIPVTQAFDLRGFPTWSLERSRDDGVIVIEYEARPGAVERAGLSGPTGFRLGYLGAAYGLFSGRQVLLLPTAPGLPARVAVRLIPPPGQEVHTTWPAPRGTLTHAFEGRDPSREVLDAVIAVGRFEARRSPSGRFEVLVLSSVPEDVRGDAERRALALEDYLSGILGHAAGPTRLILVPKTPDGLSVAALSAPGGLGLSLGPGLPTRWLTIGRAIGRACLAGRLAGLPAQDPERRILEALPTYLTVQFSQRDGWRSKRDWYEQFYSETVDLDLREPDDTIEPTRLEWRTAVALENLARELERRGGDRLEEVAARTLGRQRPLDWNRFLANELSPQLRARLERWLSLEPDPFPLPGEEDTDPRILRPPPAWAAARKPLRRFDFYFGARNLGLLEQCGCRKEQFGGMARRATVLRRRLAGRIPAMAVELGDAVPWDHESPPLDSQKIAESDLVLSLMARAGIRATVVGHAEISYGAAYLAERMARLPPGLTMLSANVAGPRIAPARRLDVNTASPPISLIGAISTSSYDLGRALEFEDAVADLSIEEPGPAVVRALAGAPAPRLTIVAGPLGPRQVLEIHAAAPEVRLIVTSNYFRFLRLPLLRFERPIGQATLGMLDDTLVVLLKSDAKALVRLGLGVEPDGRIAAAELEGIPLDDAIPDDPDVRRRLDRHYAVLASTAGMPDLPPMGEALVRRLGADYVGSGRCASCHPDETAQWLTTAHATAFITLLQKHRQGVPGCFACHVTGYRQRGGYRAMSDRGLRHVQCESCHGPGGRHLEGQGSGTIVRVPPASVCRECHTEDHSDMTDANFADYWARVVHESEAGAATSKGAGSK